MMDVFIASIFLTKAGYTQTQIIVPPTIAARMRTTLPALPIVEIDNPNSYRKLWHLRKYLINENFDLVIINTIQIQAVSQLYPFPKKILAPKNNCT